MDYTTVVNVRDALHVTGTKDDALISRLVVAASRTTDRVCSGSLKALDYFKRETIANERLYGAVDIDGNVLIWPRKAVINSVAAFSWRETPLAGWHSVDLVPNPDLAEIVGPSAVKVWAQLMRRPVRLQCMVSYDGGYAAATDDLPADLVELVNLMAGRIYREDEGGLTDAIGIATIGSIQFTKAVPERYAKLVSDFKRTVPYDVY